MKSTVIRQVMFVLESLVAVGIDKKVKVNLLNSLQINLLFSYYIFLQIHVLTSVPTATRLSSTNITWRNIVDFIPVRSRSNVPNVWSASLTPDLTVSTSTTVSLIASPTEINLPVPVHHCATAEIGWGRIMCQKTKNPTLPWNQLESLWLGNWKIRIQFLQLYASI